MCARCLIGALLGGGEVAGDADSHVPPPGARRGLASARRLDRLLDLLGLLDVLGRWGELLGNDRGGAGGAAAGERGGVGRCHLSWRLRRHLSWRLR